MDLIKVGEKLMSSVRSFNLLSPTSDRPEVPARAAAAAAVARALAGVPPHQRLALSATSSGLASLYDSGPRGQTVEQLEEEIYEEDFDPVRHVLENIPIDENDLSHIEKTVSQRLVQLDVVTEQLSHKVMEHYEELVKGMEVVTEVEQDLQVANVICKNGRRHLSSSMNEVSRDLIVTSNAKRKQFFLDMLPVLTQLQHCLDLRASLDSLVDEGNYSRAFQILAEYLQLLDHYTELSAVQEMNRGIEAWLMRTLEKLDTLLLGVCQKFNPENYIMVADAYALIDDIPGFVEKLQNAFTQIVLMETQTVLKDFVFQGLDSRTVEKKSRLTYNDLCFQLPETKFRLCLLKTLEVFFDVMCSYYSMMTWTYPYKETGGECLQIPAANKEKESMVMGEGSPHHILAERHRRNGSFGNLSEALRVRHNRNSSAPLMESHLGHFSIYTNSDSVSKVPDEACEASSDGEFLSDENRKSVEKISERGTDNQHQVTKVPSSELLGLANGKVDINSASYMNSDVWDDLRREAVCFVGQALDRGRKTFWQLVTSRISTLFSSDAIYSVSTHQFLQCYEFVNIFILAGEAFCGTEAIEFRQKMRSLCEKYFWTFHRQNIEALLIVLEKENWQQISPETIKTVNLAGLVGDGAPLLISYHHGSSKISRLDSDQHSLIEETKKLHAGFSQWFKRGNPFGNKKCSIPRDEDDNSREVSLHDKQRADSMSNGTLVTEVPAKLCLQNGVNMVRVEDDDESEDLLADFIDEDSQLPSRASNAALARIPSSRNWIHEEIEGLTGSSVSLLRSMDKYARLMQKLETVSLEFFKGICQLFELYFYVIFKTFGQRDSSGSNRSALELLNPRLRLTIGKITQGLQEQRIKIHAGPVSPAAPISFNNSFFQMDAAPSSPIHTSNVIAPSNLYGLKESCIAVDSITRIGQILRRSRTHLQSMLPQSALASLEDFYSHTVESVSDLKEHIYRATARLLLNINGYVERISNVKWELKELGMEHNGYVDLLLGEFKYYKTRLAHGGISKEVAETRFASHTIVLRRLVRVKEALCQMVISNKWGGWKQVDTEKAKIVKDLIFSDDFWNRVEYALELTEPLMSMLRYADTDEPCLGNIYDAMDSMLERMKSVIQRREQDPDTLYSTVEKIVLHRWNKMTTPLHLLAYALSPRYYSSEILDIPGRVPPYRDPEVAAGYKRALNRLFSDPDVASNVRREFVDFVSGKFAEPDAINDQSRLDAIGWWYLHGERYMYLQPLAIKILSQVQELFLEYGVEFIVETLVEGFSRVKRCTNEGRALMSLDLQVLINGLQHLAPGKIKSNMQIVEAYIKAYYLPETEYIHWARAHPEYSKAQVIGLINLVASMNNWKRKTRVELIEKIETGDFLL